jgi:uncharacterized protein YegP (UPF0339 family)
MDIVYEETLYSNPKPVLSKPITLSNKQIKRKSIKKKATRIGKFEVYTDKAGEYRFRLKAPNGEIIAVSEGYHSKQSCMNGIQSVKKNVLKPKIVEPKKK